MSSSLSKIILSKLSNKPIHPSQRGEVKLLCPKCKHLDHNGNPTLNFNVNKGVGRCVYCTKTYSTISLAKEVSVESKKLKKAFKNVEKEATDDPPKEIKKVDWVRISYSRLFLARRARSYLINRGMSAKLIKEYSLGVCYNGRNAGRVFIPVFMYGKLVYYQSRAMIDKKGIVKYLNPVKSDGMLGKSDVVAYLDEYVKGKTIIMTEGLFSAIGAKEATGLRTIAILGKTLSDHQRALIAQAKPRAVVVMLDPDTDRSVRQNAVNALRSWGIPSTSVDLPDGKDPWDCYVSEYSLCGLLRGSLRYIRL